MGSQARPIRMISVMVSVVRPRIQMRLSGLDCSPAHISGNPGYGSCETQGYSEGRQSARLWLFGWHRMVPQPELQLDIERKGYS